MRGGLRPWMSRNGHDFDRVWASVIDVCVKTVIAAAPTLRHNYRNAMRQMDHSANTTTNGPANENEIENENENGKSSNACFEILGVDVMLDEKLKCWLVEVNHSPSFATDSELDRDVKESLITDTLRLVRLDQKAMKKHRAREQTSARERLGVERENENAKTDRSTPRAPRRASSTRSRDAGAYRLAFPDESSPATQASYDDALRAATEAFETHGAHARARDAMRRAAETSRRKLAESRVKALFHEHGAALPAGERFRKAVDRAMRHRERTGEDADWGAVHPKPRGFLTSRKATGREKNAPGSSRGSSRAASRQGSAEGRARGAASAAKRGGASGGSPGTSELDATSSDDDDDDDAYGRCVRGLGIAERRGGGFAASAARDSLMRGASLRDPPSRVPRPAPRNVVDLQGDAIRRLMESRAAEARASLATAEAKAKLGRLSLGGTRDAREAVRRFESALEGDRKRPLNTHSGESVDAASGSRAIGHGTHLRHSSGVFGTSSFAGAAHARLSRRARDPRAERPERGAPGKARGGSGPAGWGSSGRSSRRRGERRERPRRGVRGVGSGSFRAFV